jgi:hypothetical protein
MVGGTFFESAGYFGMSFFRDDAQHPFQSSRVAKSNCEPLIFAAGDRSVKAEMDAFPALFARIHHTQLFCKYILT